MQTEYYIVADGRQQGPFPYETLKLQSLSPDTLVWKVGLPDWVKISELPELAGILVKEQVTEEIIPEQEEDKSWFAMFGDRRVGPASVRELIEKGLKADTPVWHAGLPDWVAASTQAEIAEALNNRRPPHYFAENPQYGQNPNFSGNPQYGQHPSGNASGQNSWQPNFGATPQYTNNQYSNQNNGQYNGFNNNNINPNPMRTNWLPWAIVATVVGFLTSCIGAIFGIIGIIQANKANGLYAAGYDQMAEQANNTARTMTIIGFVFAGIGIIGSALLWNGSLLNYL